MTQPFIKNIFFITVSCILFFLELVFFAGMQQHQFQFLFCFFIILIDKQQQKRFYVAPILLLSILSYLDTNIFGWSLSYVLATMMLADYFDQHLHIKWIIPYLLLTAGLFMQFGVNFYMLNTTISSIHATEIIVYNTIILIFFIIIKKWLEKLISSHE
jgi:hypothetical protein